MMALVLGFALVTENSAKEVMAGSYARVIVQVPRVGTLCLHLMIIVLVISCLTWIHMFGPLL